MKKYSYSILGGTFDHFHSGHEHFLNEACVASDHLTIGLTTEVLHANKEFRESIEDFETRKSTIEEFISTYHPELSFEIIALQDIYGTTLETRKIDAIFITEHGIDNTKTINEKRLKKGWDQLQVEMIELVKGNDGQIISSTRIRKGEIDRLGFAYKTLFSKILRLPEHLRPELQDPWGEVLTDDTEIAELLVEKRVFTVGDVVSTKTKELEIKTLVSVIDGRSERKDVGSGVLGGKMYQNKNGEINTEAANVLFETIDTALSSERGETLLIDGEEDLLALPLILYAPFLSIVCYGLRDKGMVAVAVSESLKEDLKNLVTRFTIVE